VSSMRKWGHLNLKEVHK